MNKDSFNRTLRAYFNRKASIMSGADNRSRHSLKFLFIYFAFFFFFVNCKQRGNPGIFDMIIRSRCFERCVDDTKHTSRCFFFNLCTALDAAVIAIFRMNAERLTRVEFQRPRDTCTAAVCTENENAKLRIPLRKV